MLKDVVLNLSFLSDVTPEGKEVFKTRRFNQVRLDLTDAEVQSFGDLISSLTGEVYVKIDKLETKSIM